jgi:N-hydroxyarylamine O-acetyltransferase
MQENIFDVDAWLARIGYNGQRQASLATLRGVIAAHSATIPFENIDVLLGRPPGLDVGTLQRKLIAEGRGGYCFEHNTLLFAGLSALDFVVTGLLARVIRGMPPDATDRPATHMVLRVDLPEGAFLADVGYGNQTPTAPLAMRPEIEQQTPHEMMRLWPVGEELTLQVRHGADWQSIYRLSPHPRITADFEVANWFTATHPNSPFVNNLIVARPGPERTRHTLFNGRLSVRRADDQAQRFVLDDADFAAALRGKFGLVLSDTDLTAALAALDHRGTRNTAHPFFA